MFLVCRAAARSLPSLWQPANCWACAAANAHAQRAHVWNESIDAKEAAKADSFYDSTIEKYAQQPLEKLSLRQMLHFGEGAWAQPEKVLKSAQYVQSELPRRLARRLLDLQLLPYIVVTNPHIKRVYLAYRHAFEALRQLPPICTLEDNTAFTHLLHRLVDEHAPMLDALATGLRECRARPMVGPALRLDPFLDGMLRSRISRRVIAEQHLHIANHRPGYVGVVCTDLRLRDAVEFAAQRMTQVCMETYGVAPEVVVEGPLEAALPYIPTHLDYMLYELLKNSARAVVEHHGRSPPGGHPPIKVSLCGGTSAFTVRVSDQGGGIPAEQLAHVFSYGWTTIPHSSTLGPAGSSSDPAGAGLGPVVAGAEGSARSRMAGLGFGLPMSRLYARYFGGELRLQSIPGYGVDAYLTLQRLEHLEWQEVEEGAPHTDHFCLSKQ